MALWSYLMDGGHRASVCWHRRAGKDEVGLHYTAVAAHRRVGAYWHCLPEQAQARKAIWEMVTPHTGLRRIDEAFPIALREATRENEMFIKFKNGSTWQLVGSDNFNSLVGASPCGLVFSEYALADPSAWAYLRPIVRENQGWAVFISTPRGKNHFYNLHTKTAQDERWFRQTLTVRDTQMLTALELRSELSELQDEHGEAYGRSMYDQEYFCSFEAAIPGAIWADCLDRADVTQRIVDYAINPYAPVDTAWDLGRTDDTAIWFRQFHGTQMDVCDYFAASGMDIDNPDQPEKGLVQVLLARRRQHGVTYGTHWLPHDARPRTLAGGGKSILQQFQDAARRHPELGRFAIVPRLDRQEGIQAARKTFPRCRFHKTNCDKGLLALRHYHREWDATLRKYNDQPVHDWSSHGADAFRYLSLSWKYREPGREETPLTDRLVQDSVGQMTFGAYKQQHFRQRRQDRAMQEA